MKRPDLVFTALLVPFDYAALVLAGWVAYNLRFHAVAGLLPVAAPLPFAQYMQLTLVVALAWVGVMALAGVYSLRHRHLTTELGRVFFGISTSVLLIIMVIFFQREFFQSRFIILAGWVLGLVFVWITHGLVRGLQRALLVQGLGVRQAIVFGQDQTTDDLLSAFHTRPSLGLRVVKTFPEVTLESLAQLDELLKQGVVDEVIQADPAVPKQQTVQLLDRCQEYNVVFRYAADVFATQATHVDIQDVAGVPIIEIKRTPLDGWGRIFKRVMDLIGASLGLIVFLIPGLLVAIAVKLDSAGPVFLPLDRVGQGQRRFRLWKFRSMIKDAHALKPQLMALNERSDGPLFKMERDPRITRVGRFIRKTSLDELPQVINVLRGDMSLVGPRPHEPEEVARYEKHHKKLLAIKPGMTGMAQVSGRSNLGFEEEVRLDTYYIEHWSLGLDLAILLRTPLAVFRTKTAA